MLKNAATLEPKVYTIPRDIDHEIARLKLRAMGMQIDTLTPEQVDYLSAWESGT
jgi:adenosylhomocysteinase